MTQVTSTKKEAVSDSHYVQMIKRGKAQKVNTYFLDKPLDTFLKSLFYTTLKILIIILRQNAHKILSIFLVLS